MNEFDNDERTLWSAALVPNAVYSDPSLPSQWHLGAVNGTTKGAHVSAVWDEYRGTGVIVGLLDDGFDYTHPDLVANYDQSLDYDARNADFDAYSSDTGDRHGTTTAGVIGAALDNATGGAGVAPGATLVGYRMGFNANGSVFQLADLFTRVDSLDVANNSWSYDGFLVDTFSSGFFSPIQASIDEALATGRDGLGTVIVFSAGNGRGSGQDTNYHNFQNYHGHIVVAATDSAGNIAGFSTPGASILVAAPGVGVFTTDRAGSTGYSAGDYVSVNGTSYSAPIVSGIAALMLEANPGLGWRDVQEILGATAIQTGSPGSWSYNDASGWNGGAMHVSHDFGFGLVDALAAVRVAESWRVSSTSANELVLQNASFPSLPIADLATTQSMLALPGGLRIDWVEVEVSLLHTSIGDLRITLTSPGGTQSVLFDTPPTSQDNISFTFSTTHDWGEDTGGNWMLEVTDLAASNTGLLQSWTIRAYGDAAGDDTYLYTDEFGTLAAADPARRVLSDSEGIDGINTAAIASAVTLDLRPGETSTIDGQIVTIDAGTLIENADTGDGNDTITGSDAANSLRGWRGDDYIDAGAGDDTLAGGTGNDVLLGGIGNDTYWFDGDFGQDIVSDYDEALGNVDVVRFGGAITSGSVSVDRDGLDLLLATGADHIRVQDWFGSAAQRVERVEFAGDGSAWIETDLRQLSNLVPVAANPITDQFTAVGEAFSHQLATDSFFDADLGIGDFLVYAAALADGSQLPVWLGFDAITQTFSGTAGVTDTGAVDIRVTATDSFGASAFDDFRLSVSAFPNNPPVAIADGIAVDEGATSANLVAELLANDTDADAGDTKRIVSVGVAGTSGTVAFDPAAQILTYTAGAAAHDALAQGVTATDSFGYTMADGVNATSSATVTVTITGVNDAPVVQAGLMDATTTVDAAFVYTVGLGAFVDVDAGDELTYGASLSDGSLLPGWLQFDGASRTFSGTAGAGDAGVLAVRVTATDTQGAAVFDDFVVTVNSAGEVITGTAYGETLNGTSGPDEIHGLGGNDTIHGLDGDDVIVGGVGRDTMYGGSGDDTFLITGADYDVVNGGGGFDRIVGSGGNDTIRLWDFTGANTVELIEGGGGIDVVGAHQSTGTTLDFSGTQLQGIARIEGGTGNDTITGSVADDVIVGGAGRDTMYGGSGDDTFLITGADYDVVNGGGGFDRIVGSGGNDTIRLWDFTGANTVELIEGGGGIDVVGAHQSTGTTLDFSGTQLQGIARIEGGTGNDTITGSVADDVIVGGAGRDTLDGGAGNDTLDGGEGNDSYLFGGSFGQDVVTDHDAAAGNVDVIRFGNGILSAAVTASRSGNSLVLARGSDSVTVLNWYVSAADRIERIEFVDEPGTVWDVDTLLQLPGGNQDPAALPDAVSVDENAATPDLVDVVLANDADPDAGDSLRIVAVDTTATAGSVSFDAIARTLTYTANAAAHDALAQGVTATDSFSYTIADQADAASSATVTVTVTGLNDAPVLTTALVDQTADQGIPFVYMLSSTAFTDVDQGDTLTYSAALAGGSPLPAWLQFDGGTRTFSGTPGHSDAGTLDVRVSATDLQGASVHDDFVLTVEAPVNESPLIGGALAGQAVDDIATLNPFGTMTIDDPDTGENDLIVTVVLDDATKGVFTPESLAISGFASAGNGTYVRSGLTAAAAQSALRQLEFDPSDNRVAPGATETTTFTVTVDDGDALASDGSTSVVAMSVNDAPTLALPTPDQAATEDIPFVLALPAASITDADPGDTLAYGATLAGGGALPDWLLFDTLTRTFSGTPENDDVGALSIEVSATDPHGATATDTFAITVANTNDAPVAAPDAFALTEDWALSLVRETLVANDFDVDPTDDTLTIVSVQDAQHGTVELDAAQKTTFIPEANYFGPTGFTYTIADGNGAYATAVVSITVVPENDAPTLAAPLPDQVALEDSVFSLTIPTTIFVDVDAGDTLTYGATLAGGGALPGWLSFDALTRTFSGTPGNDDVGTVNVEVTATDLQGTTAADTFTITIANTNDAPMLLLPLADQSADAGVAFVYTVGLGAFVDVDAGDELTYGASLSDGSLLPGWLQFDGASRTFSGTAGAGDAGVLAVRVTATDTQGAAVFDDFVVTVNSAGEVITGTAYGETLNGTSGPDEIHGLGGNDTIHGLDGDDVIVGGVGRDTMYGGSGDDTFLITGADYDVVNGGGGFDRIVGSGGNDTIRLWDFTGANTVELIEGGGGIDVVGAHQSTGTTLDFSGTQLQGIARIEGGTGNDTITGSVADDVIVGGAGRDTMYGGSGDDTFLITGADYDVVNGGGGFDRIVGSGGNDTIRLWDFTGANTVELIEGGGGIDVVGAHQSTGTTLDFSGTQLQGIARIEGGTGNDTITGSVADDVIVGGAGRDTLDGGAGNDTLDGGEGSDNLIGGAGDDTLVVDNTGDTVIENAGEGLDTVLAAISYVLPANVEVLNLAGAAALNGTGNELDNVLNGNAAANRLDGLAGADMLYGDAGDDIFAFQAGEANGDTVLDFSGAGAPAGDTLQFSGYGAGATLAQVGTTDYWTINYGASSETIQLVGVTSLQPTDYTIV